MSTIFPYGGLKYSGENFYSSEIMIAKTTSSVALKALTGSGDTTNQPVVNNNIIIHNGLPQEEDGGKFIEPNPYSGVDSTFDSACINPEFTIQFKKMVVHLR